MCTIFMFHRGFNNLFHLAKNMHSGIQMVLLSDDDRFTHMSWRKKDRCAGRARDLGNDTRSIINKTG